MSRTRWTKPLHGTTSTNLTIPQFGALKTHARLHLAGARNEGGHAHEIKSCPRVSPPGNTPTTTSFPSSCPHVSLITASVSHPYQSQTTRFPDFHSSSKQFSSCSHQPPRSPDPPIRLVPTAHHLAIPGYLSCKKVPTGAIRCGPSILRPRQDPITAPYFHIQIPYFMPIRVVGARGGVRQTG